MWRNLMRRTAIPAAALGVGAGLYFATGRIGPSSQTQDGVRDSPSPLSSTAPIVASISESRRIGEHGAGLVLRAAEDAVDANDGICLLITHTREGGDAPPNGRPVKVYKSPKGTRMARSQRSWCDTLWMTTNTYTEKVAELNANPHCSVACWDAAGGAYVVLYGAVTAKVARSSKTQHVEVLDAIWAQDEKQLRTFYQDGIAGDRFVLLEFVPERIKVVSTKFGIAHEANSWSAAELVRQRPPPLWPFAEAWRPIQPDPARVAVLRGDFDVNGNPKE